MKCYYAFDEKRKVKVLIPGCMAVAHSNEIDDCTCKPATFTRFEKEIYNKVLEEKCREIEGLCELVIKLEKRIEILYKKKSNEK